MTLWSVQTVGVNTTSALSARSKYCVRQPAVTSGSSLGFMVRVRVTSDVGVFYDPDVCVTVFTTGRQGRRADEVGYLPKPSTEACCEQFAHEKAGVG